jgi:hypothetical protein
MALNNQEAKILVGTKDAYITSTTTQSGDSAVTSQSVNFVDVGIKLYVTPTINSDGFITMKIKPEISSAERTSITSEGKITQVPIVTTSESETAVMVKDGVTLIIGGLRKDERSKTVKKVPLLGDIPLVGFFLRSTSDEVKKTELVILLTPHIMSGESSYTDFSEINPVEGAVAKMVKGDIITEDISLSKQENVMNLAAAGNIISRDYYQMLVDRVNKCTKKNSPKNKKGEVKLNFSLSSNGNLVADPEVIKATDSSLIPFAIKAIKDASPFAAFPKSFEKTIETFYITIEYR